MLLRRLTTALMALTGAALTFAVDASAIELSDQCPAGFALEQGVCRLSSRYDVFPSVQAAGLGGTKTALPARRDGFTPQQVDLGRYLFFDPILSPDNALACASCHLPERGFSDGQPRSIGNKGAALNRAAPTLWNVAFLDRLFWDGRARSLEEQMLGPLFADDEMANTEAGLLERINANSEYRRLFSQVYDPADAISLEQLIGALVAFESSLISLNSRYDQYALGYSDALDDTETKGLNVFRSFVARCAECHTPPLFTNREIAVIGAPEPTGVGFDEGAGASYNDSRLRGGFRVPSLRNIALTEPYMHSGRFTSLAEVVSFYNAGRGNAVPDDQRLYLHWHITSPELGDDEELALLAFLDTLTDESFLPALPSALPSGLDPASYRKHVSHHTGVQ